MMAKHQRSGSQQRRSSAAAAAQGRLISLFAKLFLLCFSIVVISDIILLNKKDTSIDLEAIVQEARREQGDAGKEEPGLGLLDTVPADSIRQDSTKQDEDQTESKSELALETETRTGPGPGPGSAYLTMYGEHRFKSSFAVLPKWLQEYFIWHRDQTGNKESKAKYLIISCVGNDKCGGFSDRLRTLPFYLFLASRLDRVLCIYWSRPFGLDWFLQPLPSGIDWRCPADFEPLVNKDMPSRFQEKYRHYTVYPFQRKLKGVQSTEEAINVISKSDDRFYAVGLFNQDYAKIDMSNMVFHAYSYEHAMPNVNAWMHVPLMEHIFRTMFEPIEPIAKSINATMSRLGLVENQYTSVHVRAKYPADRMMNIIGDKMKTFGHDIGHSEMAFEGRYKKFLTILGENALHCGMQLKPDNKLFLSTDSVDLTRHFIGKPVKLGETQTEYTPLGIDSREEIRHLEYGHKGGHELDHVELYPLIEDLLILGGSQCVAHGIGSFGAFGAGLAGDRCRAIHRSPVHGGAENCPNGRGNTVIKNITDEDLIFGEKVSELGEGRLPPAKPQKMQELNFSVLPLVKNWEETERK